MFRICTLNLVCIVVAATTLEVSIAAPAKDATPVLCIIDFEGFAELTPISNEYADLGVTFALEQSAELPLVCVEGFPGVGFHGPANNDAPVQGLAALTDPPGSGGDPGKNPQGIVMTFDPPVDGVSLYLIDVEGSESYEARALNGTEVLASQIVSGGDPDTGDGVPTPLSFMAPAITSVAISPRTTPDGYAIDYVTFSRPSTTGWTGPKIRISQESSPGAGDFDQHVLGYIHAFITNGTAASLYNYGWLKPQRYNGVTISPLPQRSHLFLAQTADGISLVVVHGSREASPGGYAETRIEISNDPDGAIRTVNDDPGDGYWDTPDGLLFESSHDWDPNHTDGTVISGLDGRWAATVQFTETDGNLATPVIDRLSEWFAYSVDGPEIALALEPNRRARIEMATNADFDLDGDVDQDDFGYLQARLSGGLPFEPGCDGADLDGNGLVDERDMVIFAECALGPAIPAIPVCTYRP